MGKDFQRLTEPGKIWQSSLYSAAENAMLARMQERLMAYEDTGICIDETVSSSAVFFITSCAPALAEKMSLYLLAAKDDRLLISSYRFGETVFPFDWMSKRRRKTTQYKFGDAVLSTDGPDYVLKRIRWEDSGFYYDVVTEPSDNKSKENNQVVSIYSGAVDFPIAPKKFEPTDTISLPGDFMWFPSYREDPSARGLWILQMQERLTLYESTGLTPDELANADMKQLYLAQLAQKAGFSKQYIERLDKAIEENRAFIIPYRVGALIWVKGRKAVVDEFLITETQQTLRCRFFNPNHEGTDWLKKGALLDEYCSLDVADPEFSSIVSIIGPNA